MYIVELVGPGGDWEKDLPDAKGVIDVCSHSLALLTLAVDAGYTVALHDERNYLGPEPTDAERGLFRQIIERLFTARALS